MKLADGSDANKKTRDASRVGVHFDQARYFISSIWRARLIARLSRRW